jgi:hypothetical protein
MTAQQLFLAMVVAAFATFTVTLGGVSAWVNLARAAGPKA